LHGRHHRQVVPRIRGYGVGRGSGLGGRVTDPDTGFVLAVSEGARATPDRPRQPVGRALFRVDDRSLRPRATFCLPPSIRDADVDLAANGRDRVPLRANSEGVLPSARHGYGFWRSQYTAGFVVPFDGRNRP